MKKQFVKKRLALGLLVVLSQSAIAQTTVNTNQPVVNIFATDPDATEIPEVPPGMGLLQRVDPAVFTVTRSGSTGFAMVVYYSIGGTASNGVDYVALPGTVTIPKGDRSALIEVDQIDDFLIEGTETVILTIEPPVCVAIFPPPPDCYLVGRDSRAIAYIHDNDFDTNPPPVVTIIATDPDASETGPDTGTFTVSRTGGTSNSLDVFYFTGGTAQNGIDYLALANHVVIPAGAASADITVTPIDDPLVEKPETVIVQLRAPLLTVSNTVPGTITSVYPPPYLVGVPSNAVVTIADNDISSSNLPPMVNIVTPADGAKFSAPANILIVVNARDLDDAVSTVEFFEGANSLGVRTNLPVANPLGPFVLNWTNVPAGTYTLTALATDERGATALSSPVHITVGETNRITNLPPIVTIVATDPIAAEGTNFWFWPVCTATGLWQTNASPTPILGANPPAVNTATFKIRRSGDTNADLTVFYGISGTASNGVDYEMLPGEVTIPAGERAARIIVVPIDDDVIEPIETVVLHLELPPLGTATTPPPYRIGIPGRAAAIIVDNDSPRPTTRTLPDGCFHLCQPGTNGFWFRLEASTDLVNWMPVCTNSVTDGAIHFVDPDAVDSVLRFYRTIPETNPPAY